MGPDLALLILSLSLLLVVAGARVFTADNRDKTAWAEKVLEVGRGRWPEALARFEDRFETTRIGRRIALRLSASLISVSAARAVAATIVVTGFVFTAANWVLSPSGAAAVVSVVVYAGALLLKRQQGRAHRRFRAQLPDVARSLAATSMGQSVSTALERTAGRVQDPAASVLRRIIGRITLGWSTADALLELHHEMPDQEVGLLVSTLIAVDSCGGDVAKAMQGIASVFDARRQLAREVKSQMSGALATSRVVAAIGIAMPFAINAISPGALEQLTGTPIGLAVTSSAIVLLVLGIVLIRRIARIEL